MSTPDHAPHSKLMPSASRLTSDTIVGLFIFLAVTALVLVTFVIRQDIFGDTIRLRARFDMVPGLEVGAPVLVSGIRGGRVASLDYEAPSGGFYLPGDGAKATAEGEKPVIVTMVVRRDIPIYSNATLRLVQQGFMGDKRVEIDPGSSQGAALVNSDYKGVLVGEDTFDMERSFRRVEQIVADVEATTASVRQLATDENNIAAVRDTLANVNASVEQLTKYLKDNEESINATVADLRVVMANMKEFSEASKKFLGPDGQFYRIADQTEEGMAEFRAEMKRLSERADTMMASVDEAVKKVDAEVQPTGQSARAAMDEMTATLEDLRKTNENLNAILAGLRAGEGTAGRILKDPRPFEDLQQSIEALRQFLAGGNAGFYDSSLPYRAPAAP